MMTIFEHFNGVEIFFLICAIIGGVFVIIRLILQLVGVDHGLSNGGHTIDLHHSDSDVGFQIFSLHSLSSFLLMFGLVGLALYSQSKLGVFISIIGAIAAGLGSIWLIGKLFSLTSKLQSSGTIQIDSTIGTQGKVYLTIPEDGTGRVLVSVKNSLREYDAASHDSQEIPTGTPIRVIWVDGNILVVERI